MGNSSSVEYDRDSNTPLCGLRIMSIKKDYGASKAGLEIYFDFIVECCCCSCDNVEIFKGLLERYGNREITCVVYNSRTGLFRDVLITLIDGELGASLQLVDNVFENRRGLHVTDVMENSLAERLELRTNDYIMAIGNMDASIDALKESLQYSEAESLNMIVYDAVREETRVLVLDAPFTPLGCELAEGFFHQFDTAKNVHFGSYRHYTPLHQMKRDFQPEFVM